MSLPASDRPAVADRRLGLPAPEGLALGGVAKGRVPHADPEDRGNLPARPSSPPVNARHAESSLRRQGFRGVRPGYGGHRKRVRGDGILLAGRSGKERAFDEFIGFE